MRFLAILFAIGSVVFGLDSGKLGEKMQVRLSFGSESIVVDMENNAAARGFVAQLPLELEFSDYVGKEKIAKIALAKPLDTSGVNGYEPNIGDLFYFAPWGNIGIFYEKQPVHSGLVPLGKLQGGVKSLKSQNKNFTIKFEKM